MRPGRVLSGSVGGENPAAGKVVQPAVASEMVATLAFGLTTS
jgi:hypothetical protein